MSGKRNPWINVILVLAVLAFVGFSMIPLLGTAFKQQQPSTVATPTPTSTISGEKRTEIEAQVKGYESVLKREPQNPTALRGVVEGKLQLGDIKGAIVPLEEFAKLNPNQTDYTVLLAQLKQRTGDPEGAALAYREILTTKPGDLNALQGYAELQIAQKRPEAAIALIQDTLKTANQLNDVQAGTVDVPSVQLLLGLVYASQQRYTEALVIYDEAIRVNKQDFRPVLAKAMILKQQGKTAEAQSLFTTAVSLAPAQYKDQVKRQATESAQPSATPTPPPPNQTP
ncbi:MAG TPA: Tfp pilus assembly protein PilF [Cyanobacteria bacterium UBA11149]|nr:Tfp pilus assembly protein PilF [Cyanobacteria bacterium UBA11366]HBR75853.1 Tfp pilus assembly protein PilF [Cyanobacteria bacterium UBA11159]HBS69275.1 Tfp pilus assembly protein PilF [Cyanobacteria bacterium UBA11153]HBW90448.1 Tfp pilus assembly protein PilF [Cyanobacteria bacterium UBA11149]HCA96630.1 Tfp pilus assembly protein PilF [Cyanobacteria bacterium UBA9226]